MAILHGLRLATRSAIAAVAQGRSAWRGAVLGMAAATSAILLLTGMAFASQRGAVADALIGLAIGWLLIALVTGSLLVVAVALRYVPLPVLALGIGATLVASLPFSFSAGQPWALIVAGVLVGSAALAGAGALSLTRFGQQSTVGRVAAGGSLVAGLGGLLLLSGWLSEAPDPAGEDPGLSGPFAVRTLSYGSGEHPWRQEFGAAVDVRTRTVDGTPFLGSWQGLAGSMRTDFWGFGPDALPLNATIWYPEGEGPFPLVLVVHGNARMELPSDIGYAWLAVELASRGYVVASIDQNYLNSSITRLDLDGENDARAWLLLEHLRLWREWQADSASPMRGLADLDRIALIGQSRAGEAVASAAHFNTLDRYPSDASVRFDAAFGIRAVVAIAANDGLSRPAGQATPLDDVSYLAVHGGMDNDVPSFSALRQFHRTGFRGDQFHVRSAVYLPQANHGQFNTEWGRFDALGPARWLLDTSDLMTAIDQRAAGRVAIAAFLDAVLLDRRDRLTVLVDHQHPDWPASARPVLRYADSSEIILAGFDEDADPSTGTLPGTRIEGHGFAVWREQRAPLRLGDQGSNVVVLGWSTEGEIERPTYSIHLPDDWQGPDHPVLALSVADSGQRPTGARQANGEPIDLTVEVVDASGAVGRFQLGKHGGVPPARGHSLLKRPVDNIGHGVEPIARTFRLPLAQQDGFDPARLREIRLLFDRTPAGMLHLELVTIGSGP